jgi:hypothetical protein
MNPLKQFEACGRSRWLDYLKRGLFEKGELRALIERDGLKLPTAHIEQDTRRKYTTSGAIPLRPRRSESVTSLIVLSPAAASSSSTAVLQSSMMTSRSMTSVRFMPAGVLVRSLAATHPSVGKRRRSGCWAPRWTYTRRRPLLPEHIERRVSHGTQKFTTDGGNYIADCAIAEMPDPAALEARLSAMFGVVENGLFIGMTSKIVVGRSDWHGSDREMKGAMSDRASAFRNGPRTLAIDVGGTGLKASVLDRACKCWSTESVWPCDAKARKKMSRRVRKTIKILDSLLHYDVLYLGGGNGDKSLLHPATSGSHRIVPELPAGFGFGTPMSRGLFLWG